MPKYRKALFISFDADRCEFRPMTSYHYQKDKDLRRKYTIDMAPQHRRKSLYKHKIPFVRINFQYGDNESVDKKFRISQKKSNKDIADELMAKELRKLEPNSIIYISAHGIEYQRELIQHILHTDGGVETQKIKTEDLVNLMKDSICSYVQTYLQIKLLVCESAAIALDFMSCLNNCKFRNTSVVAYNSTPIELFLERNSYSRLKQGKNEFILRDYGDIYSINRRKRRIKHNSKQFADNKVVYHNYNGVVERLKYRDFKDDVLKKIEAHGFSCDDVDEWDDLGDAEEIILLQSALFQSLSEYLNKYINGDYNRLFHGETGYKRAVSFCDQINSLSAEYIINDHGFSTSETKIRFLLKTLQAFTRQTDTFPQYPYPKTCFPRKIGITDTSAMTYLMRGLQQFYNMKGGQFRSKLLRDFFEKLEQCSNNFHIAPLEFSGSRENVSLEPQPSLKALHLDLDTKASRSKILIFIRSFVL